MGYSLAWLKLSPAQYSHLDEEELEWKSPSCWFESLPLELLHKIFSHLTLNDLKVNYIKLFCYIVSEDWNRKFDKYETQ